VLLHQLLQKIHRPVIRRPRAGIAHPVHIVKATFGDIERRLPDDRHSPTGRLGRWRRSPRGTAAAGRRARLGPRVQVRAAIDEELDELVRVPLFGSRRRAVQCRLALIVGGVDIETLLQ